MPLTNLDAVAALVVIDLQKGIMALPTVHPASEIARKSGELARAFRAHNLPVVLVNVSGAPPGRTEAGARSLPVADDWKALAPELDRQPGDYQVTKRQWGAFHGTTLHEYLRQRGATQIVLAGISTSRGVESTARAAHEHGYNVVLVVDAMTDTDGQAHINSIERIFPRLGEITTAGEVLDRLSRR